MKQASGPLYRLWRRRRACMPLWQPIVCACHQAISDAPEAVGRKGVLQFKKETCDLEGGA